MFNQSKLLQAGFVCLGLSAASIAQEPADREPLFGELHMHTAYSLDAYVFGTRATPDDAYEFAKGKPLKHPLGNTYQLSRPLDFMGVADHAMFMGTFAKMADKSHPLSKHPYAARVHDPDPDVALTVFGDMIDFAASAEGRKNMMLLANPKVTKDTWAMTIEAANRHNDPGTFTTLIGYE